jgi:hypothetical protein
MKIEACIVIGANAGFSERIKKQLEHFSLRG